ncbi:MAG: F0F1 ATP synthase subunit delta [Gemmatimonadaceae bacterium]|nr:F0F1 ATP synthase subunit delta [Gemmatimonadaceae bacterium]
MALREAMLATARAEADTFRASRASALAREAAEQEAELDTRVRNAVFGMTRKVLGEMADATLETQLVAKFARELTALPETTRKRAAETFVAHRPAIGRRVRSCGSAFALEPTQRDIICNSVITLLGEQPEIDFRVDPSLVVGIELDVADHTVGWSMSGYVKSLERAVADRPVSDA